MPKDGWFWLRVGEIDDEERAEADVFFERMKVGAFSAVSAAKILLSRMLKMRISLSFD